MGTWKINLPPEPCTPYFPGQTLTRAFSGMLVSGPFHWIITLPRSSRKMSFLLKLFQESSTCQSQEGQGRTQGVIPPAPRGRGMAAYLHLRERGPRVCTKLWATALLCDPYCSVQACLCVTMRPRRSLCGGSCAHL